MHRQVAVRRRDSTLTKKRDSRDHVSWPAAFAAPSSVWRSLFRRPSSWHNHDVVWLSMRPCEASKHLEIEICTHRISEAVKACEGKNEDGERGAGRLRRSRFGA